MDGSLPDTTYIAVRKNVLGKGPSFVIYTYLLTIFLLGKALNKITQEHYCAFSASLMPEVHYVLLTSNCETLGYTNHLRQLGRLLKYLIRACKQDYKEYPLSQGAFIKALVSFMITRHSNILMACLTDIV